MKHRVIYRAAWKTCKNTTFQISVSRIVFFVLILTGHNRLTVIAKKRFFGLTFGGLKLSHSVFVKRLFYNYIYQISKFRYVSMRFLERVTSKQDFMIITQFHIRTIICVLPWDTYGQLFFHFCRARGRTVKKGF